MSSGIQPNSPPSALEPAVPIHGPAHLSPQERPAGEFIDPDRILLPGDPAIPNCDILITEDDTPVDNLLSEKQMRLLAEPLHTSWKPGRPFVAMANVGLFHLFPGSAIVPDMLLSMDVTIPQDPGPKQNRSYFMWMYGKPPEVVVEIVSNKVGGEDSSKLEIYQTIRITNYIIFDPLLQLSDRLLKRFELRGTEYHLIDDPESALVGVDLKPVLWTGPFEDMGATWMRWADLQGTIIATGAEAAARESQRADQEAARANQETLRADASQARIAALEAMLRDQGRDLPPI